MEYDSKPMSLLAAGAQLDTLEAPGPTQPPLGLRMALFLHTCNLFRGHC